MLENDPLWKLRHALAGVGLAVLLSVPLAALLGSALGDGLGGSYEWRAGTYALLLAYVVTGAAVLAGQPLALAAAAAAGGARALGTAAVAAGQAQRDCLISRPPKG
jgi:hypothetical protein